MQLRIFDWATQEEIYYRKTFEFVPRKDDYVTLKDYYGLVKSVTIDYVNNCIDVETIRIK